MKTYVVSLGCPKNTVDTEASLGLLDTVGCTFTDDPLAADLLIVSACSFLDTAWRETVEEVEQLAEIKQREPGKKLILMGCLPLHRDDGWRDTLPWVDHFIPAGAHSLLPSLVESFRRRRKGNGGPGSIPPTHGLDPFAGFEQRIRITPNHTAYVKIAEGCNRTCSFCAIPKIRGPMASRPVTSIVREVESLLENGVKEVSLLAQDITSYSDGGDRFPDLVDAVAKTGVDWIRIFYVHPASLTVEMARRLFAHPAVCRYLEAPAQHASDRMLRRMRRSHTRGHMEQVFGGIRREFPDVVIRSEVIVGFPGEGDGDFEELKAFVESMGFASLGVFIYSPESNTEAASLDGRVQGDLSSERAAELADIQKSVTFRMLADQIGTRHRILIDRRVDPESCVYPGCSYAGRYYGQAHEVDGEVYVCANGLEIGTFAETRIAEADVFDLKAELDGPQRP